MSGTVFVDIVESKTRWPKRRQRWHARITTTAPNYTPLFISETHSSAADCADAARLVCGVHTTVRMYMDGQFVEQLRVGYPEGTQDE